MEPYYLYPLAEILKTKGITPESWLGQDRWRWLQHPDTETPLSSAEYREAIVSAIEVAGDPLLGLRLGKHLALQHHGTLGLALMNSETLDQAFCFIARFLPIRTPFMCAEYDLNAHRGVLKIVSTEQEQELSNLLLQTVLATLTVGMQQLSPRCDSDATIRVNPDNYQRLNAASDEWSRRLSMCRQGLEFELSTPVLLAALPRGEPVTRQQAEKLCDQALANIASSTAFADKLKAYLCNCQGQSRGWSLGAAAASLHLTSRTLHRRLLAENTSFQCVLDDTRKALSKDKLTNNLKVEQVAHELGYQDVANFRRAFKRWFSLSPKQYKQQMSRK